MSHLQVSTHLPCVIMWVVQRLTDTLRSTGAHAGILFPYPYLAVEHVYRGQGTHPCTINLGATVTLCMTTEVFGRPIHLLRVSHFHVVRQ